MELQVYKDGVPCGTKTIPDDILNSALALGAFMQKEDVTQLNGLSLAPELTLAQQHAEELADMLRRARNELRLVGRNYEARDYIDAMLDKIKPPEPPEPPTLAEALAALAALSSVQKEETPEDVAAETLIARARRAKVMP